MTEDFRDAALDYHRLPKPGKIEVTATKPLATQRDLALAYTPGVADVCAAIIVGAAVLNGLRVVGKRIDQVKLVTSGAGAAAIACLDLLVHLGVKLENITVTDIAGVVYQGRTELMDPRKAGYARATAAR